MRDIFRVINFAPYYINKDAPLLVITSSTKSSGMGAASHGHPEHFIILDRLYGTLKDKFQQWSATKEKHQGLRGWLKKKSPELKIVWNQRLLIMYDIAQGMRYLYKNK